MTERLPPGFGANVPPDVPSDILPNPSDDGRERLKFILVGSTGYVRDVQLFLARCGAVEVGDWSRLLPAPEPGEVMSILVQSRRRE